MLFWESEYDTKMSRIVYEIYNIGWERMRSIVNNDQNTALLSGIILNLEDSEDLFIPFSFSYHDKNGTKIDLLTNTFGAEAASYAWTQVGSRAVYYGIGVVVGGLVLAGLYL